jgi:EmrB/QacA subfamily drug resistance transporter
MTMADRLPRDLLALIGAILLGVFLVQMDSTMVNIALESLRREFQVDLSTVQWISAAYLLAMAAVIPVAGWAIDRFNARTAWLASLAVFTVGSLLCGLAWSASSLIAMRVVQGIGGGMMMPLFQTILARRAAGQEFGRVMALVGAPLLLGPVLGPVLGGVLVDHAGWRWIFLINLPVCLVAAWAAVKAMPVDRVERPARLDVLGLALLSAALVGIVYGLSQAGSAAGFGTGSAILPLAVGAALLAGFVAHARHSAEPIVDLRLFRDRNFATATVLMFLAMVALLGTLLLLPLYYQQVHGYTPMHAGLLLAPYGVGSMVSLVLAGKVANRFGVRPVALTGVLLLLCVALCLTRLDAGTDQWLLAILTFLAGLGFGAVLIPAQIGVYSNLPHAAVSHATTAVRVFQQLGGSVGVAVLAVALQHNAGSSAGPADLGHAFGVTYWWAAGATALAIVPVLLLRTPRRPADVPDLEPAAEAIA